MSDIQSSNGFDEEQKESLSASVECLNSVLGRESTVPNVSFKLEELYNKFTNNTNVSSENINNKNESKNSKEELSPSDFKLRRDKFLHFVKVLKEKGFFKEFKLESIECQDLLESARVKYNQRFPKLAVGTLKSLNIIESDFETESPNVTNNSLKQ